MYQVSEDDIDYILADIEKHGIVTEDLQNNLLDHMCCVIEREMPDGASFKAFYASMLPRFFSSELREIQVETDNLIRFKNYYAMKKTLYIAGIASSLFTILGIIFKTFHLAGAGVMLVLGVLTFSLVFLPLMIALKFKDDESTTDKVVFGFGFLLAIGVSVGVMFKLMHWPMANVLMISGISLFTFGYVPLYFITRIRRPDLKFNTIVNSVLMFACGSLLFAMFNLGNSHSVRDSFYVMHQNLRQEVMDSNSEVESRLSQVPDSARTLVDPVVAQTQELVHYIEEVRVQSIVTTQNANKLNAATMNITHMSWGLAAERLQNTLMDPENPVNGIDLKNKIIAWKELMATNGVPEEQLSHWVNLDSMNTLSSGAKQWEDAHFGQATIVSVVTYLDQLALEINMRTLQYLDQVNG